MSKIEIEVNKTVAHMVKFLIFMTWHFKINLTHKPPILDEGNII